MRPIVREAIIPLLIAGSIGVSYVGTTYLPRLDPRPHVSSIVERISEYWDERRSASAERHDARAETIRTPIHIPPASESRPVTQPSEPSPEPAEPYLPSPTHETPQETSTTREAEPLPTTQPSSRDRADASEPTRTIETIISEPERPEPRTPESELEGIIGAWQAATLSRMSVIEPYVERIADDFRTPPATIYGIILSESSLYPDALSIDGKRGLLQHEPHVLQAIVELSRHAGTPLHDPGLIGNPWNPEMSLRAYHLELKAHREYLGMHDVIDIHVVRGAAEKVSDVQVYLQSPEAREHRERIERRIREAETLLSFSHGSREYTLMHTYGSIPNRLIDQYDAMLALVGRTSGQYREAYLTNAVSYARILDLKGPVRGALERVAHEQGLNPTIEILSRKLDTPLGVDHR